MSMSEGGYYCGYLIGGIGGGVFVAVVAAIAIVNAGIGLGALVGSIRLGCLGLIGDCFGCLFKSSQSDSTDKYQALGYRIKAFGASYTVAETLDHTDQYL